MEKEIKFENRYYADQKVLKEYTKHVFCKMTRIMGIILMIVSLCGFGLSLFAGFKVSESLLFYFLFFWRTADLLLLFLVVKEMKKQSDNLHGGTLPETIIKFGNKIEMTEGKVHMEFEYSQIMKVHKLPNLYALSDRKKSGNSYSKGGICKRNQRRV